DPATGGFPMKASQVSPPDGADCPHAAGSLAVADLGPHPPLFPPHLPPPFAATTRAHATPPELTCLLTRANSVPRAARIPKARYPRAFRHRHPWQPPPGSCKMPARSFDLHDRLRLAAWGSSSCPRGNCRRRRHAERYHGTLTTTTRRKP